VFVSEGLALRGKAAIVSGWKSFYDGPRAPFSWEPDRVEVLDSGTLAHSSGPVRDPNGKRVGTFNSVWRRERGGAWKIVFRQRLPAVRLPLRSACASVGRAATRPGVVYGQASDHAESHSR